MPRYPALSRAEAGQKQAVARLGLAESNFATSEKLVKQSAVSQEEFNTRESELAQAQADVLAAESNLRTAKLDREFADIQAPISGVTGRFNVTVGNFISGGSAAATLLTTIVPHHPIYCNFEVDEHRVLQFTRLFFEGEAGGRDGKQSEVEIAVSAPGRIRVQRHDQLRREPARPPNCHPTDPSLGEK